jgi:hypothetical protein
MKADPQSESSHAAERRMSKRGKQDPNLRGRFPVGEEQLPA